MKRAVIEQNGQLIVVRLGDENPKYPIITDGVVQLEILETIGKSEEWLLAELEKEGYDNVFGYFHCRVRQRKDQRGDLLEKKRLGEPVQSFFFIKFQERPLHFLEILLKK